MARLVRSGAGLREPGPSRIGREPTEVGVDPAPVLGIEVKDLAADLALAGAARRRLHDPADQRDGAVGTGQLEADLDQVVRLQSLGP